MSIDVAARLLEKGDSFSHRKLGLWLVSSRFFAQARDFYSALARESSGPMAVLEVCGEDFKTWFSGADVSAVPLQGGVEDLASNLEEDPTGGWADFHFGEGRALIVAPLGGMEVVWSERARREVFACVSRNLRVGGRFVFDARCWSGLGGGLIDGAPRLVAEEFSPDGVSAMVWETWRTAGGAPGVLELTLGVECLGAEGVVERKFYSNLLVGRLDPRGLEADARNAGLWVAGSFGDFCGGELTVDSTMQLWVLAKGDEAFSR